MKVVIAILVVFLSGCGTPGPDYKSAEKLIRSVNEAIRKLPSIPYNEYHDMLPYIDKLMATDSNPVLDAIELAQINDFAKPYLEDGKISYKEFEAIRDEIYKVAYVDASESNNRAKEMSKK